MKRFSIMLAIFVVSICCMRESAVNATGTKAHVYALFTYEGSACITITSVSGTQVSGFEEAYIRIPVRVQFPVPAQSTGRTGRARIFWAHINGNNLPAEKVILTPALLWIKHHGARFNGYEPQ